MFGHSSISIAAAAAVGSAGAESTYERNPARTGRASGTALCKDTSAFVLCAFVVLLDEHKHHYLKYSACSFLGGFDCVC